MEGQGGGEAQVVADQKTIQSYDRELQYQCCEKFPRPSVALRVLETEIFSST
jgi:hypothetical protein